MYSRITALTLIAFSVLASCAHCTGDRSWSDLIDAADARWMAMDFDSAIALGNKAIGVAIAEFGQLDSNVATAYFETATYYGLKQLRDEARDMLNKALSIRQEIFGESHWTVAECLTGLGLTFMHEGNFERAEVLYDSALAGVFPLAGYEDSMLVANTLGFLAMAYEAQVRFVDAEDAIRQAIEIKESLFGTEHPATMNEQMILASVRNEQGYFKEAESILLHQRDQIESIFGPSHIVSIAVLGRLTDVYMNQNRFDEAESLTRRCLSAMEELMGSQNPSVGSHSKWLAGRLIGLGRYAETDSLLDTAYRILEAKYGANYHECAQILGIRADLYSRMGEYARAADLYESSLKVKQDVFGPRSLKVSHCLRDMAVNANRRGDNKSAISYAREALTLQTELLGPDHRFIASTLTTLATSLRDSGELQDAEDMYTKALSVLESLEHSNLIQEAAVALNLAVVWQSLGHLDDADSLLTSAYEAYTRQFGQQHPTVASTLEARSSLYVDMGRAAEAYISAHEALQVRRQNFLSNVWVFPEPAALKYGIRLRESLDNFLTCAMHVGSDVDANQIVMAEEIIATKGIVTDYVIKRSQSLVESGDTVAISLMQDLRTVKQQISRLFIDGPKSDDHELHWLRIDSLSLKSDQLEKELARISARFCDIMATKEISVQGIAANMPANSLLMEFVRFMRFDHQSGEYIPSYIAVAIDSDNEAQTMTFAAGNKLDSLILRFRGHFRRFESTSQSPTDEDMSEFAEISKAIYGLLIEPIEHLITGKDILLVAPDGLLNLIPFSSLIDNNGRYLVESFPVHYLSTSRDLLRERDGRRANKDLLVLGDPDFNASIDERTSADQDFLISIATDSAAVRNVRSTRSGLDDLEVHRLPGSKVELEIVTSHWLANRDGKVLSFRGAEASEDNFKAHASGKRVIHFATHGYYLDSDYVDRAYRQPMNDEDRFVGENPLLLSGLLLAGSNLHGRGADSAGVEDGILSAYEVGELNMQGTELVILSACETGLGKIHHGEGVYGLRRAFQMAGAKMVISSLWPVSDNTTTQFMKDLYRRSDENLPEKLQQVAIKSIQRLRKRGQPDHPYNWAPFVATGCLPN